MISLDIADLETAPCGFLVFSDNGLILSINQTLVSLLAYNSKDELSGKHIESLLSIAGKIFYQTHFFPLIKLHDKTDEIFFSFKTKDNRDLPVICNAIRKSAEDGSYNNHCIIFPVRERQKYEQELLKARRDADRARESNSDLIEAKKELEIRSIESDKQVTRLRQIMEDSVQFSKAISHDLQEPIRKLNLFSEMLLFPNKTADLINQNKYLTKIKNESSRLRHLAVNLERFISLNFMSEKAADINLNEIISISYNKSLSSFEGKDVSFTMEPIPVIEGYELQLQLLFDHLLANSFQFQFEGRILNIKIECSIVQKNIYRNLTSRFTYVDHIKIDLTDNGIGFETTNPEKLFHLWKKSDASQHSLGFGLAICKHIVDNHFGAISIDSKKDQGSTVSIFLPMKLS